MTVYIYTLSCPTTGQIKYVGKTINLKQRFRDHMKDYRNMNKNKSWIKSLKIRGLSPVMQVIDVCLGEDWRFMEDFWIQILKTWGFDLKNQIHGGRGITVLSEESKNKISLSLKGKKQSEERRLKNCKKVLKYDLDGSFICEHESITHAEMSSNIKNGILGSIKRKQSAGGYQWRFLNGIIELHIEPYKKNMHRSCKSGKSKKPVYEIDKNGSILHKYESISFAEQKTGLSNIFYVCAGLRAHTRNRYFIYA